MDLFFLFSGLYKVQDTNFMIRIHGDSNLESLSCFTIDLIRIESFSLY